MVWEPWISPRSGQLGSWSLISTPHVCTVARDTPFLPCTPTLPLWEPPGLLPQGPGSVIFTAGAKGRHNPHTVGRTQVSGWGGERPGGHLVSALTVTKDEEHGGVGRALVEPAP